MSRSYSTSFIDSFCDWPTRARSIFGNEIFETELSKSLLGPSFTCNIFTIVCFTFFIVKRHCIAYFFRYFAHFQINLSVCVRKELEKYLDKKCKQKCRLLSTYSCKITRRVLPDIYRHQHHLPAKNRGDFLDHPSYSIVSEKRHNNTINNL